MLRSKRICMTVQGLLAKDKWPNIPLLDNIDYIIIYSQGFDKFHWIKEPQIIHWAHDTVKSMNMQVYEGYKCDKTFIHHMLFFSN